MYIESGGLLLKLGGISRTLVSVIIVIAIVSFATGFLARSPAIPQTITTSILTTRLEVSTVVSTYTYPQTVQQIFTRTETRVTTIVVPTTLERIPTATITTPITVTKLETLTYISTTISTIATTVVEKAQIPVGATPLPYTGSVVFALVSSGFNFNGSSRGSAIIYIPAGWGVEIMYMNNHTIPHSIALVRNNTAVPQSSDIGSDGVVIASQPPSYRTGIPPGQIANLTVASVSEGIYWIACGVPGHAAGGMWIILVSSRNVSAPYIVILQQSEGTGYSYIYGALIGFLVMMIPLAAIVMRRSLFRST